MRKFSKKIAMMMVLAMLVSLFSGIVSASAASIWSAKSVDDDNYAVVMGETIEVKKGEFINFDLFKADEEATKAGYTYTWESSDAEVLFIVAEGKNSGYARVKGEVGEKATVSATFTNLTSGKSATRSFDVVVVEELKAEEAEVVYAIVPAFGEEAFVVGNEYALAATVTADGEEVAAQIEFAIDGKAIEGKYAPAAAGDVTIVITATVGAEKITKEVKCVVDEATAATIVGAKQKDAKTVELTFDKAITEEEAKTIELYLGTVVKNNYKKAVKVKDNVVTFESYATFGNAKTWTFVYGDSKFDLKSSQGEVAKVVITGPEFFYLKSNGVNNAPAEIKWDCYDALDVKVDMPTTAYIEWKVDNTAASLSGNYISFTEKDKVAALSGIYHTGKFDEANGWNEVTFEIDPYIVTSVDNNDAAMVGIGSKGVATSEKYDSMTLPANSTGYKLWIKFLYDDADKTQKKAEDLKDGEGKALVTYESTDSSKLIVDQRTGELIPLKQGPVDVIVNIGGEFFAAVTVTVGPAVASTAPTFKASTAQLSNSKDLAQSAIYTVEGKTNYGADETYTISKVEVKSDPYNPNTEKAAKDALKANFVSDAANKVTVAVVGKDGSVLKTGNYVFAITAKGETDKKEYTQNVSVYVRDAKDTKIASVAIEFVGGSNAFDTAANKTTANFDGKVAFNIVAKNSAGVAIKNVATVTGGLEIKLGSDVIAKDVKELALYSVNEDGKGIYTVSGSATTYDAIKNGTYVITGKVIVDGTSYNLPNTSFTVSNSQAAPAITNKNAAITLATANISSLDAELIKCFEAPKNADNGDYTFSAISLGTVKKTVSATNCAEGEYAVYVESVKITQTFKAGGQATYTVNVNQNITLTVTK